MGEYADMAVDDALDPYWEDWEEEDSFRAFGRYPSARPGSPLAKARMRAHQALDPLWQSGHMTRKQAYKWLARMMGIPRERCHIIQFSEGDCLEAIRLCRLEILRRTIPEQF